jgi:hypothetical protein
MRQLWMCLALLVSGCSCGGNGGGPGPCDGPTPDPSCGELCTGDADCAAAFYCGSGGVCTADCTPGGSGCRDREMCSGRGRCIPPPPEDAAGCPGIRVGARRATPTVIVIIDQSGSMDQDFSGAGTRWDVLRDALTAQPGGFIYDLQGIVRFGVAMYSSVGGTEDQPADPPCPMLTTVDPALDNFGAINPVYQGADPIEDTPTGDAVDAVLDRVLSIPDPGPDPTIFILATDGEPDRCEQGDPNPHPEAHAETISAVERAYGRGIRTFLIDVGNEVAPAHKQDVANAGIGVMPGEPDAPYWTVTDDRGLRDALGAIIGGTLSCEVTLEGELQDLEEACRDGVVELNGRTIPCDGMNGWRVVDSTHIELVGSACTELMSTPDVVLVATFPCGVVLI